MKRQIGVLFAGLLVLFGLSQLLPHLQFQGLGRPEALLLGISILPLLWLGQRALKRQRERLDLLIENPLWSRMQLQPSQAPAVLRLALWTLILVSLTLALARPQGPPVLTESESSGIEILVALDISDSMKATDEQPSRLGASKRAVRDLMSNMGGDRMGFIVFSGEAFSVAPFSTDYDALSALLSEVDHGLLPSATTDLEEVLQLVQERFARSREQEPVGQILVLLSDGENQLGDYEKAAKALAEDGVRIFSVGVGSERGARIPERHLFFGSLAYKTWRGQEVVTKLDDRVLKKLANLTEGQYMPLNKVRNLPSEINAIRGELGSRQFEGQGFQSFEERFVYWLLLALLLLALERSLSLWFVPGWRIFRLSKRPSFERVLKRVLQRPQTSALLLFPLLMGAWSWPWESFWFDRKGHQAYEAEDYESAEEAFKSGLEAAPGTPQLQYNLGNSLYQQEKYPEANQQYQALGENEQITTDKRSNAYFNLGNSYFRQGEKDQKLAQEAWKRAIEAYQKSLQYNPQNKQAIDNLNYVQKRLEELPRQPQQNNQQNQQQNQQGQNQQNEQGQNPDDQQQNEGSQGQQNQSNSGKSQHSPLDGVYTDEDIEQILEQAKQREQNQHNSDQFQRRARDPRDAMDRFMQQDSNVKDW